MRRRLQSFSLAACKDKTTLKTAFHYDNVGLSTLNNNKWNPVSGAASQNSRSGCEDELHKWRWSSLDRVKNI